MISLDIILFSPIISYHTIPYYTISTALIVPLPPSQEIYEDLSDDIIDEDNVRTSFAALGARPSHATFAGTMATTLFSVRMVSASQVVSGMDMLLLHTINLRIELVKLDYNYI